MLALNLDCRLDLTQIALWARNVATVQLLMIPPFCFQDKTCIEHMINSIDIYAGAPGFLYIGFGLSYHEISKLCKSIPR